MATLGQLANAFLAFAMLSVTTIIVNAIRVENPIPPLPIRRCGYLRYKIPANIFTDEIDGNTRNLKLTLRNSTGGLSQHDWVALDAENQTIYAVLNDQVLKNASVPSNHYYQLVATTQRGETAFATIQFILSEEWRNASIAFLVNFAWVKDYRPSIAIIQAVFAEKFMAYLGEPVDLIRYTFVMQDNGVYSFAITNCTEVLDICNHKGIKEVQSKLYTDLGTVPAFRTAMQPEFYVSYIQVAKAAECQKPEGPRLLKQLSPITLQPCTPILHPIPYDVFYDEEDGYNLQLQVYAIDGIIQKLETQWLYISSSEHALYGVVTNRAINDQPPNGYNVTLRAYDSQYLWAETHIIVRIAKMPLQMYYQFTLHLSLVGNSFLAPLIEQHTIALFLDTFFKANFSNPITYNLVNSKDLITRFSICTLPPKCDNSSFYNIWNKMVAYGTTPTPEFKSVFSSRYILNAVTPHIDPICLQALDPPVPTINPWVVPITRCGGFQIEVPSDLFYDKQDGGSRNLHLQLFTHDEKELPTSSWLLLNQTSQIIYGLPTNDDIETYEISSHQYYKLVATDKSGLNGSLKLQFSIQPTHPSTYTYQIVYRQSGYTRYLEEMATFKYRLSQYLDYPSIYSIGLEKVTYLSSTTRRIYYRNCSSMFNPCDTDLVNRINSRLFVPSLNSGFRIAMAPEFSLLLMSVSNTTDCQANTPPRVTQLISTIRVSVCGVTQYSIHANTFYDKEDGKTPNLRLLLTDSNNNSLSQNSWLSWNSTKQAILFTASVLNARNDERATFLLSATDKGALSTYMSLFTSISGPLNVLSDCKIQMKLGIDQSLSSYSNAYLTEIILSKMAAYFGLDSTSKIGLVSVLRESSTSIIISWSFCSTKYVPYTQSSTMYHKITNIPDYDGFSFILRKVFMPGTLHVEDSFKSAFQGFSVISTVKIFTGDCSNFPPKIGLNESHLIFNVSNCGFTKIPVRQDWFYDLEDGDALKLNLKLLDRLHSEIANIEGWIGFDKQSKAILISIGDKERKERLSTGEFYLRATDSGGKFTELSFTVNIKPVIDTHTNYEIALYFVNKEKTDYLNDTSYIADGIAQAFSLAGGAEVMVHSFHEDKGYIDGSVFVWSTCKNPTCSSTVLQSVKQQQESTAAFNALKEKFIPRFELQRIVVSHMCGGMPTSPVQGIASLRFNVSMCGVSLLKLALSTFSDDVDGSTKNLRVNLLDSQKQNVTASSWIQLNAATLQLYAVPSLASNLHLTTSRFYLQGVNTRSLSTEVQIDVHVKEEPYTNDCPVSLVIKRKYGTDKIVDLSVLHTLLKAISDYYNDKDIKIKVLKFEKLSTYDYSLHYSNCSYAFPTKQAAKKGHDGSFRQTINEIFYKLVKPDGTIQSSFSSSISNLFEVTSVRISYECIEAPPYPTVSTIQRYASTCKEYRDVYSKNMFNDARDGTNLKYSVTYPSGRELSPNEWITFNEKSMEVYGMVTEEVKRNAPAQGYHYLFVATDSSGRSANVTYMIHILNPMPYMPIKVTVAYNSTFNDTSTTPDVLVNMSRKFASYLDGASRSDEIMINSINMGKSMTFSHCKISCTVTDYMKIASKLQNLAMNSKPSSQFVAAAEGTFVPERIYVDGPSCLPISTVTTMVQRVIVINWPKVCGFIEYKIPEGTFTDRNGRKTIDFLIDMYQHGKPISFPDGATFTFDKGYQILYGPVVTSKISSNMIYDVTGKHPQSGHIGSTSLTLNMIDYDAFETVSKSLCLVTIAVTTRINPAYSDAYIIKKFMNRVARYLGVTSQEIQITSYSRDTQYPTKMFVQFANCHWYSMLSSINSEVQRSQYTRSRDDTIAKISTNVNLDTSYTAEFSLALRPDFTLLSASFNDWCKRPPNKPPVVNISVLRINAKPCTGFFYQIPENAFTDEDGNARTLKLLLFKQDGSALQASDWVSFNPVTQSVHGRPTKQAHNESEGLHKFELKATDQFGLTAKSTVEIRISGSAPGNQPPKINMNNFKITLPESGIYRAKLPESFASDVEDGSMSNMHTHMTMINGSSIPRDSWIQFDHDTYEVYTMTPTQISNNSPAEWTYKVVVMDSCGGVATTTITFTTQQSRPTYYGHVFRFKSKLGSSISFLDIQIKFIQLISKYFKDFTSIFKTEYFRKFTGVETYEYSFSNYSTTRSICPMVNTQYIAMQMIFSKSVLNTNSFATYIAASFNITSYENKTSYVTDNSPSNTTIASTDIEVSSCGGYEHDVSKYFSHKSNLQYSIRMQNGEMMPTSYPLFLSSNVLKIVSLGTASAGVYKIRVTAHNSCNQTSYKDIEIRLNNSQRSTGYQLKFEGDVNPKISTAFYVSEFQKLLQSQLKNPGYRIEVQSYSQAGGKLSFTWMSCFEAQDECNRTNIEYLHASLFTAPNHTDPAFISRLGGTFTNAKLIEYAKHCNFTSHEPPMRNKSLDVVVHLCRQLEFRIPADTFSDKEDGDTRNLRLFLLTETNTSLPNQHWLQFNRVTQTVYGYPRISSSLQRDYSYNLIASDIQGNSASTSVRAQIRGSIKITYLLSMFGIINSYHHGPNIDYEILLIKKIGNFFKDSSINDISFIRQGNSFTFSWSFCRMTTSKCDCMYIKYVENKLINIDEFKREINPEFELINVTSKRYDVCIHPNPPELSIDMKDILISAGQTFSYFIDDNHFYDLEDGYTKNLTLYIADNNNIAMATPNWIQVNQQHICGLVTLSEIVDTSTWSSVVRKLVARDACGKEARDSFSVVMTSYKPSLTYKIIVYVMETYDDIRSNCSKMQRFSYLITSYVNMSISDFYVDAIYANISLRNDTSQKNNYTAIVWGLRSFTERNCRNETIRSYREKLMYENGSTNRAFYQYMKSDFHVVKVDDNITCGNGTLLPIIFPAEDNDFLPWILLVILVLAILFLFCWLCWICIPRCCASCCTGCIYKHCACCSSFCGKCCAPGGKYASLDEATTATDVVSGVLSNAKTVPDDAFAGDVFGKEAVPGDIEAPVPAEDSLAPLQIDEDEMKMDQDPAPMAFATPDDMTLIKDFPNDMDHNYENYIPGDDDMETASMPLPNDITGGVAAMPRELPEDAEEISSYAKFEDNSSVISSKGDLDEGASATPFSSDLNEYQQSSYSESSYSRIEEELEVPQTLGSFQAPQGAIFGPTEEAGLAPIQEATLGPAQEAGLGAPQRDQPSNMGKRLSLPQMPNVFSEHDLTMPSTTNEGSVMTETTQISERRITSEGNALNSNEGRKGSISKPLRLYIPRHSVTSLSNVDVHEVITDGRPNRRRSSQMVLKGRYKIGNKSNKQDRRESRRDSKIFVTDNVGNRQGRRSSSVRLSSSDDLLAEVGEPVQLMYIEDASYHPLREYGNGELRIASKRSSIVSNGSVARSNAMEIGNSGALRRMSSYSYNSIQNLNASRHIPNEMYRRSRRIFVPLGKTQRAGFSDNGDSRTESIVRRVSLPARQPSAIQRSFALYEDDNIYDLKRDYISSRNSRSELLGYESDSTDSGYAITRRSKRYRRQNQPGNSREYLTEGDGYTDGQVQIRRKSVIKRGKQEYGSQGFDSGGSYEMWARETNQGITNTGFNDDSFV